MIECPTCWNTGFYKGYGAPCTKGCEPPAEKVGLHATDGGTFADFQNADGMTPAQKQQSDARGARMPPQMASRGKGPSRAGTGRPVNLVTGNRYTITISGTHYTGTIDGLSIDAQCGDFTSDDGTLYIPGVDIDQHDIKTAVTARAVAVSPNPKQPLVRIGDRVDVMNTVNGGRGQGVVVHLGSDVPLAHMSSTKMANHWAGIPMSGATFWVDDNGSCSPVDPDWPGMEWEIK